MNYINKKLVCLRMYSFVLNLPEDDNLSPKHVRGHKLMYDFKFCSFAYVGTNE